MQRTLRVTILASICGISTGAETTVGDRNDLVEIEGPVVFMQQPALTVGEDNGHRAQSCGVDAIAVDRWGNLYVADRILNIIRVWSFYTLSGDPLEIISSEAIESAGLAPLTEVRAISTGAPNRLLQPVNLYVLDQGMSRASASRILMRPYLFSTKWVQLPFHDFRQTPQDFTVDISGRLIVSESSGVVEALLPNGSGHDIRFGKGGVVELEDIDGLATSTLTAVDTDYRGNIYLADSDNRRIIKLDASGNVTRIYGDRGNGKHRFHGRVIGVAVDWRGNVYGRDASTNLYSVFSAEGRFLTHLGKRHFVPQPQSHSGQFFIDKTSRRFVIADGNSQRISIHTMTRDHFLSRDFSRHEVATLSAPNPLSMVKDR